MINAAPFATSTSGYIAGLLIPTMLVGVFTVFWKSISKFSNLITSLQEDLRKLQTIDETQESHLREIDRRHTEAVEDIKENTKETRTLALQVARIAGVLEKRGYNRTN